MKKLIALTMALAIALTLCACGASSEPAESPTEETAAAETAEPETEEPESEESETEESETEESETEEPKPEEPVLTVEDYTAQADEEIHNGDFDAAEKTLTEGVEETGDDGLKQWLDKIDSGTVADSSGLVYLETCYNSQNAVIYSVTYSYEDGLLVRAAAKDAEGTELAVFDGYEYDAEGRTLVNSTISHNESGFIAFHTRTFEYQDGLLVKTTDDDGSYAEYEYDENGLKVKENNYQADGSLDWVRTYQYDENGHMIRYENYNADGKLEEYGTFEYDEHGIRISGAFYKADGTLVDTTTYN